MTGPAGHDTWWRGLRRQADTVFLMVAAATSGLAGLVIPGAQSQAIAESLPGWANTLWYAGLLAGGLTGLAAALLRGRRATLVERHARWLLAGLCSGFGFAVLSSVGIRGVVGVMFVGLFAVACLARIYEIHREMRHQPAVATLRAELDKVRADLEQLRAEVPHRREPL